MFAHTLLYMRTAHVVHEGCCLGQRVGKDRVKFIDQRSKLIESFNEHNADLGELTSNLVE